MLHEKLPLDNGAAVPLHVAEESPDKESEAVPVTTCVEDETLEPSAGDAITSSGRVLSMLSATLVVPVNPLMSVAVPLIA
jgi:hypothetical protein